MSQETKVKLTEKVSITFPEKPDVRNMQDIASVYSLRLADSTANFNVVVQNLGKNWLTEEQIETAQLEPAFWGQLESSFIAQLGNETKVLSKEKKNISGKDILILELNTERSGKKMELKSYIFIDSLHSINIVNSKRAAGASVDLKDKFFNSLKIVEWPPVIWHEVQPFNFLIVTYSIIAVILHLSSVRGSQIEQKRSNRPLYYFVSSR